MSYSLFYLSTFRCPESPQIGQSLPPDGVPTKTKTPGAQHRGDRTAHRESELPRRGIGWRSGTARLLAQSEKRVSSVPGPEGAETR